METTREKLLEKMKAKNFDENPHESFNKMKNFRIEKIGFGKVNKLI